MTNLWIAGTILSDESVWSAWSFVGVFETEDQAVAACRDERDFVAPAILNTSYWSEESNDWPGMYHPKAAS